ncbi:MAG: ribosomal-processing cysteine protease Prp [Clostridia bacterium]|nr:ribosomal-processing cysteine protease Prp [Clostridia bacterium]
MVKARFCIRNDAASFTVTGHAGTQEAGNNIVCAAVSSAVYMTVNTITEILSVDAQTEEKDGYMHVSFGGSKAAADIVKGLKLHLQALQEQYPDIVKVSTEVSGNA